MIGAEARRRRRFCELGRDVRLRQPDRRRPTRARRRASCRPRAILRLLDRQPADRPGPGGDADADGGRLRGDRQRRHPAHAAASSSRSTGSPPTIPTGSRVIIKQTSAQLRTMLEGVLGAGGTASEASDPGLRPRRQDRHRREARPRRQLLRHAVRRSFVGFAPAADPHLLVAVIVDEPQGGDLRRLGRRARLRDRRVRAAVPGHRSVRVRSRLRPPPPATFLDPRRDEARRLSDGCWTEPHGRRRPDGEITTSPLTAAACAPGTLFFCVLASPRRP